MHDRITDDEYEPAGRPEIDGSTVDSETSAAGYSRRSLLKAGGLAAFAALAPGTVAGQTATPRPPIQFRKTYTARRASEEVHDVVQASDGGYAIVGTKFWHGGSYAGWLLKVSPTGVKQWARTYSEPVSRFSFHGPGEIVSGAPTSDGGFILAGNVVTAVAPDEFGNEFATTDAWLVRTASDGTVVWSQNYGDPYWNEAADAVIQTSDGGFVFIGGGRPVDPNPGMTTITGVPSDGSVESWVVSLPLGSATAIVQTADGGFVVTGSRTVDGQPRMAAVKLGANRAVQWSRTYSATGMRSSHGVDLVRTTDGGYALVGTFEATTGGRSMWLVKTDATGAMQWHRRYARSSRDGATSIARTRDGGYALAGQTSGGDADGADVWLVKTDPRGQKQWGWVFNGAADRHDSGESVIGTRDGGLALAGVVGTTDADTPARQRTSYNAMLVKFAP